MLDEPAATTTRRSAMKKPVALFVGLDVHKDSISVAHVPEDRRADVTYVGRIGTRPADIDRLVRRLQEKADRLIVAYEAGPFGHALYPPPPPPGLPRPVRPP